MLYITTMAKRSITGAYYSAKCLRIKVETAEGCDEGQGMLYITTMAKRSIIRGYYSPKCLRIK